MNDPKQLSSGVVPLLVVLLSLPAGVAGCGSDVGPDLVADQIGIELQVRESHVVGSQLESRQKTSTQTNVAYERFIGDIKREFVGDPKSISVESVTIQLREAKDDVSGFDDLFTGTAEVFVAPDHIVPGYTIAVLDRPTDTGPLQMQVAPAELSAFLTTFMSGSFYIGIRGATQRTDQDDFDARISVSIVFGAYD